MSRTAGLNLVWFAKCSIHGSLCKYLHVLWSWLWHGLKRHKRFQEHKTLYCKEIWLTHWSLSDKRQVLTKQLVVNWFVFFFLWVVQKLFFGKLWFLRRVGIVRITFALFPHFPSYFWFKRYFNRLFTGLLAIRLILLRLCFAITFPNVILRARYLNMLVVTVVWNRLVRLRGHVVT